MQQRDWILLAVTAFTGLMGLLTALVTWFLKELWGDHKELKDQVNNLKVKLPSEFATNADLAEAKKLSEQAEYRLNDRINLMERSITKRLDEIMDAVKTGFKNMSDRVDGKQDKS